MAVAGNSAGLRPLVAPTAFVLLWSTGFVGAKYGLPYAGPFVFLAVRLAVACLLLGAAAIVLRSPFPADAHEYRAAAISGVLLHACYLGGVFFAISRGMPAGVASVVVSLQPVLVAALATRLLGERILPRQWAGLALGVGGVVLVLAPGVAGAGGSALSGLGIASCLVALAAGTFGTLWQKRHGDHIPLLSGTAVQYAAAALVLLAAATATRDFHMSWTWRFAAAMAWLVVVLSIGAILLLLVLLRHGSASGVSSLFYLVPPATAVEAYLVLGERLALLSLVGIAVAAVGVALVVTPERPVR